MTKEPCRQKLAYCGADHVNGAAGWNGQRKAGAHGAIYVLQIGDIHTENPFKGAAEGIAGSGRRAYRKI